MNVERWHRLTFAQQMGNIGSEIARAGSAQKKEYFEDMRSALSRALELVDMTLNDSRHRKNIFKEVSRLRELLACWYDNNPAKAIRLTIPKIVSTLNHVRSSNLCRAAA